MAFLSTLGTIGGLVLQGYGMWAQSDADEQARKDALAYNAAELGLRGKQIAGQIGATKARLSFEKREARRKWKWMEEDRGYSRAQDFMNNFNRVIEREPQFKNNLMNIWGKKG